MAKRKNPYIEDFVTQSKIHLGLKQFNNNEDRLKKVYEKTLLLLFKGAKYPHQAINSENIASTAVDKSDKKKQMFIGKNGILLRSGSMVNCKSEAKQCGCSGAAETQCAYCEVSLCSRCQHYCTRCESAYCIKCTISELEESEICVSCYS